MHRQRSMAVGAALSAVLAGAPAVAQNATIIVESRTLPASDDVLNVRLEVADGIAVAGIAHTLIFDARAPLPATPDGRPDCRVNPQLNASGASFTFLPPGCLGTECTAVRALVAGTDNPQPIPSGTILYACRLGADIAIGTYRYGCDDPSATAPNGDPVTAACQGGTIVVDARAALSVFPDDHDSLYPPRRCNARVMSRIGLSRLQARIEFPPQAPVGLTPAGLPGCRLDPPVPDLTATFSCATPDCATHVAIDLRTAADAGFVDATLRCELAPDLSAPEDSYPVTVSSATATDVDGQGVPVDVSAGGIDVFPPLATPVPRDNALLLGDVSAAPESTAQLPIVLRSDLPLTDVTVGVRRVPDLDTGFAFVADDAGHPLCSAVPPLRIVDSSFTPEPCGDGDAECGSIQVQIAGAMPGGALPEGTTTIANCAIAIVRQSEIGVPIVCQFVEARSGSQTLTLDCGSGRLEVAFPTATPTETPPPAATSTPTSERSATGDGGSGCRIGSGPASAWPLVAALLLWGRSRRLRAAPRRRRRSARV